MQNLDKISQVYILSLERSGSTLLSSILNSHQNIIVANEEPFAYFLYKKYKKYNYWNDVIIHNFINDFYFFWENRFNEQFGTRENFLNSLLSKKHLNAEFAIKLAYLNFFPQKNKDEIKVIIDKQIRHHYFFNDLQIQFPKAKYIVLVRDPRDNITIKLNRAKKINTKQDVYSASVNWNYAFNTILKGLKTTKVNQVYYLKYEDLVTNTEIELKNLCIFLDIPYNSSILNFHEEINKEYSKFNESSKEIFDSILSGLKSKVNAEKVGIWKKDLNQKQIDIIMSICSNTYNQLGYKYYNSPKVSLFNKSYLRAMFFLTKKNILTKLYNKLISHDLFKFLRKFKKTKYMPG